jgi:DNA polymerase-3 subunit alpha
MRRVIVRKPKRSPWFHSHVHTEFSSLDAISRVDDLFGKMAKQGQPAGATTDHGNMSVTVQAYKASKKYGLQYFPGLEGYVTAEPIVEPVKGVPAPPRYHMGLLALNLEGYRNIANLSTLSHSRPRFNRFPRFDLNDLADHASEDVAVLTGCYFGLVQQTLITKGPKAAKRVVQMYSRWYPNTFVEIQNHHIDHKQKVATDGSKISREFMTDEDICEALVDIADELGLPVMVTQDSHYCDSSQKVAHELMKRMVYKGEEGENEFPGDSFHLASTEWVEEHHDPEHWQKGLEGAARLLELNEVEFPALDKYKARIPTLKKKPQVWLERVVKKGLDDLEARGLMVKARKWYDKRAKHELGVIGTLGHAGYFSVVDAIVKYCNEKGYCVEARGSANASLVCYAMGITSIDPIEYKLTFERFLSLDRWKPPDVDLDIEDKARPDVLRMVDDRFGAVQIGTYQQLGVRDIDPETGKGDDKGSLLVTYNSYLRDKLGNQVFVPKYGKGIGTIGEVQSVSMKDYKGLRKLSKLKVKRAYGVHPAGLLLNGDDLTIEDYVPTMLVASSDTRVSQFTGEDVEEFGYLKMDLLGQRTLTTMRRCQELMGRDEPTDFKWIPKNDKETLRYLSRGYTDNGVFQFEGYSMARGARALKIKSTMDCVLAGALFRPACIDSGVTDAYINRRHNPSLRSDIDYPHPVFEEVLKETHGLVLFQEQVLAIMRGLGLDYAGINTFFKIVKDSGKGATARNMERIKEVEKTWQDICDRNGIADPEWAWHYIEGYTKYGFNKAHSAGYGVRSYRVGYLKVHHPLEFHAALLESWAGKDKEKLYQREARNCGCRLLGADVNVSDASWTIDRRKSAIRRGLSSIKGIGATAAEELASNKPYADMAELIEVNSNRTVSGAPKFKKENVFSGNLLALKEAGALASLGISRSDYE